MAQSGVPDRELVVRHALHEVAVVGDDEEGARPRVEEVLHRSEHVRVHVVRGLVENEDVGLVQQGEEELEAPALTAGQVLHAVGEHVAQAQLLRQLSRREVSPGGAVLRLLPAQQLADELAHDGLQVAQLLVEHRDDDGLAPLDAAAGGLDIAGQQSRERRLARPVAAQDAHAVAGAQDPVEVVEDRGARVVDAHVRQLEDVLAQPGGRHAHELDRIADRRDIRDERVRRIDPELGLRRAGRRAAAQPRELLAHEVLPLRLRLVRQPAALDALENVGRVAALVLVDGAVVDLPRLRRHLIEEPPVVGDDEERALPGGPPVLQVAGEPRDALDVQVVRGLIEEEDVVVAGQQRGERDAAALSTGQPVDGLVKIEVAQEAGHDIADARDGGPLVVRGIAHDGGADRGAGREVIRLVEVPGRHVAAARHAAGVRFADAREDRQQRRLAVAVAAHDPDPVTRVDPDRHPVEDGAVGVAEADRLCAEQVHRGPSGNGREGVPQPTRRDGRGARHLVW